MIETPEKRIVSLGLTLPVPAQPLANYVPALISGEFLFVSGQISRKPDGSVFTGKLGADLTVAQGQAAARAAALALLAQAKGALSTLDAVAQVVRICGYVACDAAFCDHPQVINGASDLLAAIFGDQGRHTRSAIGVASLPAGAAVEIDAIFRVR